METLQESKLASSKTVRRIRIYNVNIATMEEPIDVFPGELWVEDSKIIYVGSSDGKERKEQFPILPVFEREIDGEGNLVIPGFKNAHTHSAMTFLRSYADDLPLQDWLYQKVFPMEAKLTKEDMVLFSKLAIMEYLTSGITANFDMYLSPEAIAQASLECGFRTAIVGGLNDFVLSLEEVKDYYERYNERDSLISYHLGFHAQYTTSQKLLEKLSELAHLKKAPVFTHNSETRQEVSQCLEQTGDTPTEYLERLGLFDYGGAGYHCIYMGEKDYEIFQKRGLYAVTNPASNLKLASGIAPIQDFLKRQIPVAIGTDGSASNNCLDMFREMFLVTGLAKYREQDASAVDALEVLRMSTVNGAKAMGLKECDTLAVGKKADLIMIDLKKPNMQPIHNVLKNLVYSGNKQNVLLTMVNGKILYERGTFHIGVDPVEVYKKAAEITERMKK